MTSVRKAATLFGVVLVVLAMGCTAKNVNLSTTDRPARAPELDAFDHFVGSWVWEAEVLNAAEGNQDWTGTAEWEWTLDNRCLQGKMSSMSAQAKFESAGIWSWHPKSRKYIWWMFNNWGYPQEGTAKYDADAKRWVMKYKSVGLDGGKSYGRYEMTVTSPDRLDWCMTEWADAFHMVKKIEMKGAYHRTK